MNQLPTCFLLQLLSVLQGVVATDVLAQSSHHDDSHHPCQEQDDHERVHDREPVDLRVGNIEVRVPAGGPLIRTGFPSHAISEADVVRVGTDCWTRGRVKFISARINSAVSNLVLNTVRLHNEGHNTLHLLGFTPHHNCCDVVLDGERQMVVQDVLPSLLGSDREPDREGVGLQILHRHRQMVQNQVDDVVVFDPLFKLFPLFSIHFDGITRCLTVEVDSHLNFSIGGLPDSVAHQDLPQVFALFLHYRLGVSRGTGEREGVVFIWQVGVDRGQHVGVHLHKITILIVPRSTREIEAVEFAN
mmetsp:Transcript_41223/g.73938  ORF Transcript_41223/g.73938 Transcript_41223/m.73938 type:complete len:302 (-) Transcript_41223:127-1032(-)